jgi:hypothetical protein
MCLLMGFGKGCHREIEQPDEIIGVSLIVGQIII